MRISDWSSDVCSSDLTRHSHFVGSTSSNWKQGQLYPDEDEGVQGVKSSPLDSAPLKRRREPFPASPTNRRSLPREPSPQLRRYTPNRHKGPLSALRHRSEERSVGNEGVSTCRYRWSPYH